MTISLRLEGRLEQELNNYAKMMGLTKSELIRNLITEFINRESKKPSPWELGRHVFGRVGSSQGNLSADRKKIIKEKLHAKKNRH
jgi:predicted DNA-binding protein